MTTEERRASVEAFVDALNLSEDEKEISYKLATSIMMLFSDPLLSILLASSLGSDESAVRVRSSACAIALYSLEHQ